MFANCLVEGNWVSVAWVEGWMPTGFVRPSLCWTVGRVSEFRCKKGHDQISKSSSEPSAKRTDGERTGRGQELAMTVNSRKADADVPHRFGMIECFLSSFSTTRENSAWRTPTPSYLAFSYPRLPNHLCSPNTSVAMVGQNDPQCMVLRCGTCALLLKPS